MTYLEIFLGILATSCTISGGGFALIAWKMLQIERKINNLRHAVSDILKGDLNDIQY